jgi:hypothetical protein
MAKDKKKKIMFIDHVAEQQSAELIYRDKGIS